MGRPALPKNVHELKGTAKKDPKRMRERENEPENVNPLPEPSKFLSAKEKTAYWEIANAAIPGVLGEADYMAVEMAARLLVKLRGQKRVKNSRGKMVVDKAGPQDHTQFFRYLGRFGMTPADRKNISLPKGDDKNPFDDD